MGHAVGARRRPDRCRSRPPHPGASARLVENILPHGTPIKGTVEEVTTYEREAPKSENSPAFKTTKIRTYYTVIRYAWKGVDNQVRFKLPFSPSTYQITKGGEVDLLILA